MHCSEPPVPEGRHAKVSGSVSAASKMSDDRAKLLRR